MVMKERVKKRKVRKWFIVASVLVTVFFIIYIELSFEGHFKKFMKSVRHDLIQQSKSRYPVK